MVAVGVLHRPGIRTPPPLRLPTDGSLVPFTDGASSPCGRRCIPEGQARRLFQQLMVAVDFLHGLGIANRDIKLENALLAGDPASAGVQLKLCDFGYSKDELARAKPLHSVLTAPTWR